MKYLLIPCLFVPLLLFAQNTEKPKKNDLGLYISTNGSYNSNYNINNVLKKTGFSAISNYSFGIDGKINYIPNTFGFTLHFGVNTNSSSNKGTTTNHLASVGGIGPTYSIPLNRKNKFLISAIYSYTIYHLIGAIDQKSASIQESFQNQSGNVISINRIAHSIGPRFTFLSTFLGQQWLFSLDYSYDLLNSDYKGPGFNSSDDFPTERSHVFKVSIAIRLNDF